MSVRGSASLNSGLVDEKLDLLKEEAIQDFQDMKILFPLLLIEAGRTRAWVLNSSCFNMTYYDDICDSIYI